MCAARGVGAEGAELPPFSGLERPDRPFGARRRYHAILCSFEKAAEDYLLICKMFI